MQLVFLAASVSPIGLRGRDMALDAEQINRLKRGLAMWKNRESGWTSYSPITLADVDPGLQERFADNTLDTNHSPLWYLIASAPLLLPSASPQTPQGFRALVAAPYVIFGLLLGGSLWYVSRRLFGNSGGYIALALYCFSPGVVRSSAVWFAEPEIGAAWGAFGAVFTAIAVAHTLYAPREVVLWNWRRILLLGLSLALAVGSQFSLVVVLPVTLAFMLYVVPGRRTAAAVIWAAAVGIGTLILFASYFFHAGAFWQGMRHASFLGISGSALLTPLSYKRVVAQLGQISPALVLALPFALAIWAGWRRARYFGNTAPLLVAVLLLLFAVGTPHYPGLGFQLVAVPFLFVFVSGIAADLLESG